MTSVTHSFIVTLYELFGISEERLRYFYLDTNQVDIQFHIKGPANMQSMHRQFGKLMKRSADDSQVSVLLKDFDNADKLLTKVPNQYPYSPHAMEAGTETGAQS